MNYKKILFKAFVIPLVAFLDNFISKNDKYWAFPVHHIKGDQFIENPRAIYEYIYKNKKEIHPILFLRDNRNINALNIDPNCIDIEFLNSIRGLIKFIKCKVIFVTHSISMDYSIRWDNKRFSIIKIRPSKHYIINLWHAISAKKLLALTNENVRNRTDRIRYHQKERKYWKAIISSSDIDSYAVQCMFYPIKRDNIWITGIPRTDFLFMPYEELPNYLKKENNYINQIKKKKKLITYAPTYRQTKATNTAKYYEFSDDEIYKLKEILVKHDAILGFRMHYFRNDNALFNIEKYIDNNIIYDFGHNIISDISPIIRNSDIIITDYSSVFIEALALKKTVIAFAYDEEEYNKFEDGLLYDYEIVFPGTVTNTFSKLLETIEFELDNIYKEKNMKYIIAQKIFYRYLDCENSRRVVEKLKAI